jgi:Tfp pilus assembly protein PilO
MTNNKRKLNSGWLAIILAALLFIGLLVLAYLLSAKVAELRGAEKAVLMFAAKESNFDSLQKSVASLSEDKKIIEDYFITNETFPGFIEQLEKMASSTDVMLKVTNAIMTTGANPVMRLNFSAEGSFPRLFQFVSLVDSLPYVMDFTQASFAQGGDQEGEQGKKGEKSGLWRGTFNLNLITANATST